MQQEKVVRLRERYIGIMSGTSMDGVDVSLCTVDPSRCILVSTLDYPFDPALKEEILLMINGAATLQQIGVLNQRLGVLFADAVNALLEREKIPAKSVKAIGSHGQTLWHQPTGEHPFTMQLGDANIIASRTGIDVVSDLRGKDVALGGEGAPLAPVFHQYLFQQSGRKIGVVNIGGMANITILGDEVVGFDTGPGNVLMDLWVQKQKAFGYDSEGQWAKEGKVDNSLLETLLSDPYFSKEAPKSTGRELFNLPWLGKVLHSHRVVSAENVQATLLAFTAHSIANEAKKYGVEELIVCGGGVKNSFLMEQLSDVMGEIPVSSSDEHGVNSEHLEAMLFAWLAYKRVHREPVELMTVTGAEKNGVLGGLYAND